MSAYAAERLPSIATLLDRADALGTTARSTPFQRREWLEPWLATVGRAQKIEEMAIAVTREDGAIALLLPFIVQRDGAKRVLELPDAGLSDYVAPIIGPAAPADTDGAARLWAAVRALDLGADLVRIRKMPRLIAGRANPLALLPSATASPLFGNLISIAPTLEEFLATRDRHFRKEVNRSYRVLEREGSWTFASPDDPEEALALLAVLAEQQSRRMREAGKDYALDQPEVQEHYRRALHAGLAKGSARVFALKVGDQVVAAIFGLLDEDRLLLLRIANAGEAWKHCSPGRLVVAETMRWLGARGYRAIDMTIGDYPFKQQFEPAEVSLVDLVEQLGWRGAPSLAVEAARERLRRHPAIARLVNRLRGRA